MIISGPLSLEDRLNTYVVLLARGNRAAHWAIIDDMDIRGWDERYRSRERSAEDLEAAATPLVIETAKKLRPGKALDLACGSGRNALYLARQGWSVTAVDGSAEAIAILRERARKEALTIDAQVADLAAPLFAIDPNNWELICICYYLQRGLFKTAKQGLVPGGTLLAIAHTVEADEEPNATRLALGEMATYFEGWQIVHAYEGKPADPAHRRAVAEIVVRKPIT